MCGTLFLFKQLFVVDDDSNVLEGVAATPSPSHLLRPPPFPLGVPLVGCAAAFGCCALCFAVLAGVTSRPDGHRPDLSHPHVGYGDSEDAQADEG